MGIGARERNATTMNQMNVKVKVKTFSHRLTQISTDKTFGGFGLGCLMALVSCPRY